MTVQYDLNSLQDLTNSCMLNFRNKDNKKKSKTQQRLPFPYVLYISLALYQKWRKKTQTKTPPRKNVRGVMSFLTLWNTRYFWLVGHLDIWYTRFPPTEHRRNGNSESYLWRYEDDVIAISWIMGDSGHAMPQNYLQWTQLNHSKSRVSTNLPRSSSWWLFLRWWKEMQHQQLLSQQWSMGPNAQTCNVTAASYATWTARDAWQTQGERQVQRVGVCQTWDSMSHLQPALYHPSHQEGMPHVSNSVPGGWYTLQKGLCVFPDLAKPHIKTQN